MARRGVIAGRWKKAKNNHATVNRRGSLSISTTVAWKRTRPWRIVGGHSHAQTLYSLLYSIPPSPLGNFVYVAQWLTMPGSQRDDRAAANKPGVTGEIGLVRRILSRGWVGQPINGTSSTATATMTTKMSSSPLSSRSAASRPRTTSPGSSTSDILALLTTSGDKMIYLRIN